MSPIYHKWRVWQALYEVHFSIPYLYDLIPRVLLTSNMAAFGIDQVY